jgi:hypothetical protein
VKLSDRLRERVQPLLDPDEQVQAIWTAKTGVNQNWVLFVLILIIPALVIQYTAKTWIVAKTNKSIVVFRSNLNLKPEAIEGRYPRDTRLGPVKPSPLWGQLNLTIGSDRLQVHRARVADVDRADATP